MILLNEGVIHINAIKYLVLVIFSLALIVLLPLGVILFSLNSSLLKPYSTGHYLVDSGISHDLKKPLVESLLGDYKPNAIVDQLINKTADALIKDDFISAKLIDLQAAAWDYLTNKNDHLPAIPIPELTNSLIKAVDATSLTPTLKQLLNTEIKAHLVSEIPLTKLMDSKAEDLQKIKDGYQLYLKGTWVLYAFIVVLLALIILLTHWLKDSGLWLGICLTISGTLALLTWLPKLLGLEQFTGSEDTQAFKPAIDELIHLVSHDFMQSLTPASLVILILGISLIIYRPFHREIHAAESERRGSI